MRTKALRAEDIPEDVSSLRGWRPARRSVEPGSRPPTRRITINVDADILAIFKAEALRGGPPYQVAMNQALRTYLRQRERDAVAEAVRAVLAALDDESVQEKIREIGSQAPKR
jgi:uncharacterized protein (DUF4415 family)